MSGISDRLEEQKNQALNEQQIAEWVGELESIKNELENPELDNLSKVNEKKKLEKRIKQLQKHLEDADVSEERYIETIQKLKRQINEFDRETELLRTQIRESKVVERYLEEQEKVLKKKIAKLEEDNKSLQEELNISRDALREEKSKSTEDSTPKDMISRKNDLANTIRESIRESKEKNEKALIRLKRDMKRKKKEKEKLEKRIAKLQQESRDREMEIERQHIKDANREAGKKAEPHTYESVTGKPDYLEKIKEIELSIKSVRSLADELLRDELYYN